MILPLPFALNSSIVLHVFLGGLLTYLWIRVRGSHPTSALTAGFAFMFGASYFLHIVPGHLPNLCTMAWIPLVFCAVDLYLKEQKFQWILLGMFALAMQVFSGHIQYVYYTVILSGFYALFHLPKAKRLSSFKGLVCLYAGAGLLTAIQLLAGWDAVRESARAQVMDIDFLDIADITPERFWCLLMPDFFDGWKNYWGGGFYWEGPVFISVTAFTMVLLALRVSKHPQKKFFGLLALFLTLLAVGKRTPLFAFFCAHFPLFSSFRGIGKLNIFITLCLLALAAMGMDAVFEKLEARRKLSAGTLWSGFIFFLLAFFFLLASHFGGGRIFSKFSEHVPGMALSLAKCALTLAAISLLSRWSLKRPLVIYGLAGLAFIELFCFAWSNRPYFDLDMLRRETQAIEKIYQQDPGDYRVFTGSNNIVLGTSGAGVWGNDPTVPLRYDRFSVLVSALRDAGNRPSRPLADPSKALGLTRLKYSFYEKDGLFTAQKLRLVPAARAVLIRYWETAPLGTIWKNILDPKFDPKKTTWLEMAPGFAPVRGVVRGKVSLTDISTDEIEVRALVEQPAVLVMSDNYSSGWKARPLPDSSQFSYRVVPVNGFQRAVPLFVGNNHFILEYRPTLFVAGKWISLMSWLFFAAVLFWTVLFRRHS